MRQKLLKFRSFHFIDASQDIGIPVNRVDAIALGARNEGEMSGNCAGPGIGTGKETILSHKNPGFNSSFGLIVVDGNVRIFEKSGQRNPVIEGVLNCLCNIACWGKFIFSTNDNFSKLFCERHGFSSSHGKAIGRRFIFDVTFDLVELGVDIEDSISDVLFGELRLEVATPGVSVAASFSPFVVSKDGIKTSCSIGLYDPGKVLKELQVFVEGEIWRVVEVVDWMVGITDVGGHLAFANVIFVAAVLNLDGGVVCFDDRGLVNFLLLQLTEEREALCCSLHPVALSCARNGDVVSGEYFFLTIIGKSVIELTNYDFGKEARTGVATRNRRARFFGGGDVLLAPWAGSCFLNVFDYLETGANHLKRMSDEIADRSSFYGAIWAGYVLRFNRVISWFMRQRLGVIENMLFASFGFCANRGSVLGLWLSESRARVEFFRFLAVVALVALFRLRNESIELGLKVFEEGSEFFVAGVCLLELLLQVFNSGSQSEILLSEACDFFFQGVTAGGIFYCYAIIHYMVSCVEASKNAMPPHLMRAANTSVLYDQLCFMPSHGRTRACAGF